MLIWGDNYVTRMDLGLYYVTNLEPVEARKIYIIRNHNRGGRTDASELDWDVRTENGPETIAFTPFADKKYRFFVHIKFLGIF